jgi:hypothetical protein
VKNVSSRGGLLSVSEVEAIFAPLESALTLPPRAFVDPAFFEAERDAIFFGSWAALCLTDLVPNLGDASPLNFLGAFLNYLFSVMVFLVFSILVILFNLLLSHICLSPFAFQ